MPLGRVTAEMVNVTHPDAARRSEFLGALAWSVSAKLRQSSFSEQMLNFGAAHVVVNWWVVRGRLMIGTSHQQLCQ